MPHDLVFDATAPLKENEERDASSSAAGTYHKLIARTLGSFLVISVQSHTVIVGEEGTLNTVCIDSGSHSSAMPTLTSLLHPHRTRKRTLPCIY